MKEYKVITSKVKNAESELNDYAQQGYKLVTIMPNNAVGFGMVIIFEKDIK